MRTWKRGNPCSTRGINKMSVADKEWRGEHITGGLSRNDAVVDAVPFVHGVPIVAGAASRVGIDRCHLSSHLRTTFYPQ